jgi:SAM-dependent methyltransferase
MSLQDATEYLSLDPLRARVEAHRDHSEKPEDVEADVIREVALGPLDHVLDVGSGTGTFLARIRADGHLGRLVALDTSPAAVAAASEGADAAVLGSASLLPFRDSMFSVVCARHMLYHVGDPLRAISEAARVLSTGGFFGAAVNHSDIYPYITQILREVVSQVGIVPPELPRSRVNSDNLPDMIREVFGQVTIFRHDNALIYDNPAGVIQFCVANLAFYGVNNESPERPEVIMGLAHAVTERFASLNGVWREPKGYVVCTARKGRLADKK